MIRSALNRVNSDVDLLSVFKVYADRLWAKVPELAGLDAGDERAQAMPVSDSLEKNLATFYMDLYVDNWKAPAMAKGLASIPSVMMWDGTCLFAIFSFKFLRLSDLGKI